jgi:hypothetical protein
MAVQLELTELFGIFDSNISQISKTIEKTKLLRSGMLSDLLNGKHEIPSTYDKLIGAA